MKVSLLLRKASISAVCSAEKYIGRGVCRTGQAEARNYVRLCFVKKTASAMMPVDREVDLLVTVERKLCWNQPIILIVSKANTMLGTYPLFTNRDARRTL